MINLSSTWDRARAFFERAFTPTSTAAAVARDQEFEAFSTYPTANSMSAIARFPWVRASFRAKALDIAGLPLIAVRTDPYTGRRERIANHPIPAVFKRVGPGGGGRRTRLQFVLDWQLTGDGYLYQLSEEMGMDSPILRLHPLRMRVFGDELDMVTGYKYRLTSGKELELDPARMIHVRDLSWEDGPASMLGTGAILALHHDLTANLAVKEMTAKAARRGRLEMMLSPKEGGLAKDAVDLIRDSFEANRQGGHAAFVVNKAIDATPLGLNPRDMEFTDQDDRTIAGVLAVAGVVPVRVGMPTANYGTSKQQQRNYWENNRAEVTLVDEQFSRLDPDPYVTIEHDLTGVEALQVSYTERQQRARGWFEMGASAKDAAEYEGFVDAPLSDTHFFDAELQSTFRPPEKAPEEGQERTALRMLEDYLRGAAERYQARHIGDEVFNSASDEEAVRLLAVLEQLGCPDAELADEVARLNDEVVHQLVLRSPGAVRIDVAQQPAFSRARAVALSTRLTLRRAA